MKLEGKSALVTGGGGGIGRGIVLCLAEEGADIAVVDIDLARAEAIAREASRFGRRCIPVRVDVSQPEQITRMIETSIKEFGKLDILVNNAGIELLKSIEEITVAEWDRVMAVNVGGIFLCCKYALPYFKKQGKGNIINMGSCAGYIGASFQTLYCASKGAVHQFTKALALECGPAGVKVNAIAPGGVNTPMLDYLETEYKKRGIDVKSGLNTLYGGVEQPQDIADVALFLASDESRTVHGAALLVDGGYTAA